MRAPRDGFSRIPEQEEASAMLLSQESVDVDAKDTCNLFSSVFSLSFVKKRVTIERAKEIRYLPLPQGHN